MAFRVLAVLDESRDDIGAVDSGVEKVSRLDTVSEAEGGGQSKRVGGAVSYGDWMGSKWAVGPDSYGAIECGCSTLVGWGSKECSWGSKTSLFAVFGPS